MHPAIAHAEHPLRIELKFIIICGSLLRGTSVPQHSCRCSNSLAEGGLGVPVGLVYLRSLVGRQLGE